jgi:hypothetical protein
VSRGTSQQFNELAQCRNETRALSLMSVIRVNPGTAQSFPDTALGWGFGVAGPRRA